MFLLIRRQMLALVLLQCFCMLSVQIHARPTILGRQTTGPPTTVMTVNKAETVAGTMTETCIITLTPITDQNGQPAVEEVKKCSITMDTASPQNNNNGGAASGTSSTTAAATAAASSTDSASSSSNAAASTTSVSATVAASSATNSATSVATDSTAAAAASTSSANTQNPAISVNGVTSVAATAVSTGSITSTPAATTSSASGSGSGSVSVSASSSGASGALIPSTSAVSTASSAISAADVSATSAAASETSSSGTGTAAAAESSPTDGSQQFALPGQKLSVLPIGLGVFAGISVIALIVVGLVTYERTKYRKAFRQRKLAESGAAMAYGGMAYVKRSLVSMEASLTMYPFRNSEAVKHIKGAVRYSLQFHRIPSPSFTAKANMQLPRLHTTDNATITFLVDDCIEWMTRFPPGFTQELSTHLTEHKPPIDEVTGVPILDFNAFCCGAHGFAVLIETEGKDKRRHYTLFDTGPDTSSLVRNLKSMHVPVHKIDRVVVSHWHSDHTGGLLVFLGHHRKARENNGLAPACVVDVHPSRPSLRGIAPGPKFDKVLCALPRDPEFQEIIDQGGRLEKSKVAHTVADGTVWISGIVPRVTPYEKGIMGGLRWNDETSTWDPEQHIMDERYLVIDIAGKGLVIFSACSHSGIVNVVKDAITTLGRPIYMIIGGLHLAGPEFASRIQPTVDFLSHSLKPAPTYILPMHCSGMAVKIALEKEFGQACVPAGVGVKIQLDGDRTMDSRLPRPTFV
ncbi:hypothetical protein EYR40_006875 [Pleurotus pulmonarius]|nr:hypothetical protein EYR40_006875 [Pleurotus pulmonarius]